MRLAIKEAYRGIAKGRGGPFGAVVARNGKVIAKGHNEVLLTNDPTRHAEVCAITRAAKLIGNPHFKGCEIYTTTEPCVMCFAAIHWARIERVYFGTSVRDVHKLGFNELPISNRRLKTLSQSKVRIEPGLLRDECRALLQHWATLPDAKTY
jgi:guanine deaminase